MRNLAVRLTLTGRLFTLTPIPAYLESRCTVCDGHASHRLFSRALAQVRLLCDRHALEFAREQHVEVPAAARGSAGL